jgi:hypothetical protein
MMVKGDIVGGHATKKVEGEKNLGRMRAKRERR